MSKFEHYKKATTVNKVKEFKLTLLKLQRIVVENEGTEEEDSFIEEFSPVLFVKVAANNNKKYINAFLKKASQTHQRAMASGKIDKDRLKKQAKIDKEIFPTTVITGWKDVINSEGIEEKFSVESCRDFLKCIEDDQFEKLQLFCMNVENFAESLGNVEDLAKN